MKQQVTLKDVAGEKEYVLHYHAYMFPQILQVKLFYINTIQLYPTLLDIIEPVQEVDNGSLSRPGSPYECYALSRLELKGDILQHIIIIIISEPYITELYVSPYPIHMYRAGRGSDGRLYVNQEKYPL